MAIDGIAGVILAGGRARRMGGGDKTLQLLAGRPLLSHVIARVGPQVGPLALNANGDPARFAAMNLPVIADSIPDFAGPLAGILAGMDWAVAQTITCTHIASIPGDTPFIPYDLISRLSEALKNQPESEIACARSSNRLHPVIALWPLTQREPLRRALTEDGIRKVDDWLSRFHTSIVDWPISEPDPFFNINTLEDLRGAERLFGGLEE